MKNFFLIFLCILSPNILKANFEEDIAFQLQTISQNNLITEIKKVSNELKFISMSRTENNTTINFDVKPKTCET